MLEGSGSTDHSSSMLVRFQPGLPGFQKLSVFHIDASAVLRRLSILQASYGTKAEESLWERTEPMGAKTPKWLCSCGQPTTTLELVWVWREAASIGQRRGRYVCYRCRIVCDNCTEKHPDADYQFLRVRLTASTKGKLVDQLLAETVRTGQLRGYLPRTDLQRALRSVQKDIDSIQTG